MGYGAGEVGKPPFFVVTHHPPESVRLDLDFTFVTDGVASAVEQARTAAGDRHVVLMGGGDVIRQAVEAGIVDELRIHLSPLLLGDGTPLFGPGFRRQFEITDVRPSSNATHITYRPTKEAPK
jgi:dihydrofolate reductase